MKKHIQHAYCRILAYVSSIHLHQSSPAQTLGTLETWKCKMQQVNFSGIEQTPAAICTALISKATPQAHLLLPHLRTGASPPISLSLSNQYAIKYEKITSRFIRDIGRTEADFHSLFTPPSRSMKIWASESTYGNPQWAGLFAFSIACHFMSDWTH